MIHKIVGWIVVILIIAWIISDPARAGTDWHIWATSMGSFFSHLTGGCTGLHC